MSRLFCRILLQIIVYYIGLNLSQTTSVNECSALNAYLRIQIPPFGWNIILSSQALFPPETYSILPTKVVTLSSTDNPCNASEITTDINNTIVLLYQPQIESENCNYQRQVYAMQTKGAKAVIFSSYDNEVSPIPGPSDDINTTIPARQIRKIDADGIAEQLSGTFIYMIY